MNMPHRLRLVTAGIALLVGGVWVTDQLVAQVAKPPIRKPGVGKPTSTAPAASVSEIKDLEQRAKKTQEDFLKESAELARDLEKAGLFEQAKNVLEVIRKVNPDLAGVKEKIDELNDSVLSSNKGAIEIDVSKGWGDPVARVEKGKAFRVEATGTYRFMAQTTVSPKGFPTDDPARDMLPGVRCGALAALIVPIDAKGKPGKPLDPIEVGDSKDINPRESGLLFLNVNLPNGHKSTGKIDVILSGHLIRNTK